ncbi:MAG: epoxide hydrolase 1, partial [Alphaproteobacteria bacterium]|nr:epoxide hydrolase 1 [Alphaproteobacteria bacterium]
MPNIRRFHLDVPDAVINRIRKRVAEFPWHEMPDDGGWQYGANLDYMKALCAYWVDAYDWRAHETRLNAFAHYLTEIDGMDVHFIHEPGDGDAMPLILSHGWPGSVVEFFNIIEPLAHPRLFGGDARDAFHVIAPSLPGFGFSSRPPRPWGPRKMAALFNKLMVDALGYDGYLAQGGDWGGAISSWLGFEHAACRAIHINIFTMRHPDGPASAAEKAWAKQFKLDQQAEDGYRTQQATKPQTLSYATVSYTHL